MSFDLFVYRKRIVRRRSKFAKLTVRHFGCMPPRDLINRLATGYVPNLMSRILLIWLKVDTQFICKTSYLPLWNLWGFQVFRSAGYWYELSNRLLIVIIAINYHHFLSISKYLSEWCQINKSHTLDSFVNIYFVEFANLPLKRKRILRRNITHWITMLGLFIRRFIDLNCPPLFSR